MSAVALTEGAAEGRALVLAEPLSFWGGVDTDSGAIIDATHPDRGKSLSNRILVMTEGRGSSSASSVLAETLRRESGPRAIILERPDPILVVGALVAQTLYGRSCPIVVCPDHRISDGELIAVEASGAGCTIRKLQTPSS